MILIEKCKSSEMSDYLTKSELAHSAGYSLLNVDVLLQDPQQFSEYCKKHKLNQSYPESMARYLNQANNHYPAYFTGGLEKTFGVEYSTDTFSKLMSNQFVGNINSFNKVAGRQLYDSTHIIKPKDNQQTGTSLVFSVPKSLSVHFAIASQKEKDKIMTAMQDTNKQMIEHMSTLVKPSNNTRYEIDPSKTELLVGMHNHYEDREVDPHLHTHGEILNFAKFVVKDKKTGLWSTKILAIDTQHLFKQQLENSQLHDTLLNSNLRRQGYITEPCNVDGYETFRLSGYTKEIEDKFSSRKYQIIEELKEFTQSNQFISGEDSLQSARKTIRSRTAKEKQTHNAGEVQDILYDTCMANLSSENLLDIESSQSRYANTNKSANFDGINDLQQITTKGYLTNTELRTYVISQLKFQQDFKSIAELNKQVDQQISNLQKNSNSLNNLVKVNDVYTILKVAETEHQMIEDIIKLSKQSLRAMPGVATQWINKFNLEHTSDKQLNEGQQSAIYKIAEGKKLTVIIGDAGVGKTSTAIKFASDFHKQQAYKVYGISTQEKTSKALNEASVDVAINAEAFIRKAFHKNGKGAINQQFIESNKRCCLIIDEAGMLGAEHYKKLAEFTNKSNSKLILVGDHKQLESVSFGSSFKAIQTAIPQDNIARLDIVLRQKTPTALAIANGYRDRKIDDVMTLLKQNDLLTNNLSHKDTINKLVDDYMNEPSKSKLIICGTNKEIDLVNSIVRDKTIEQETIKVSRDNTYVSHLDYANQVPIEVARSNGVRTLTQVRNFCAGDQIIFNQNDKKINVANSDKGTITSIVQDGEHYTIKANVDDRTVEFSTKDYNKFNHCFAISSHKSQGSTCESVYHLGSSRTTANKNYVDGSRHTTNYKLYVPKDFYEDYVSNAKKEEIKFTTLGNDDCKTALETYNNARFNKVRNGAYNSMIEELVLYKQSIALTPEQQQENDIERTKKLKDELLEEIHFTQPTAPAKMSKNEFIAMISKGDFVATNLNNIKTSNPELLKDKEVALQLVMKDKDYINHIDISLQKLIKNDDPIDVLSRTIQAEKMQGRLNSINNNRTLKKDVSISR